MSGARTTSASSSCSAISARTRSSFASSRGQLTGDRRLPHVSSHTRRTCATYADARQGSGRDALPRATCRRSPAHPRRRGLAVRLLPRDDRVAQHADPLDLGLHHVAGLEVERRRVLAEAGDAARPCRSRARRRRSSRAPSSGRGSPGSSRTCSRSATPAAARRSRAAPSRRSCGSGISSGVTIHGPSGQNVSIALQNENTPERISRRWMSRAVMSLKIT